MSAYQTTAAYVSGGICGAIWQPGMVGTCGMPHKFDCRRRLARFSDTRGTTFREMLLSELIEYGGDFQNAHFTADTILRIERRKVVALGKYEVHVWERNVGELRDCADLVDTDCYVWDFDRDES